MNGFNQVNYRRCKNVCFGETMEQSAMLDDLGAVVCDKCFLVHKDRTEVHICTGPMKQCYSGTIFYRYV